jgi:hypothetical protein
MTIRVAPRIMAISPAETEKVFLLIFFWKLTLKIEAVGGRAYYPHQRAGDVPQNARGGDLHGQPLYTQIRPITEVEPISDRFNTKDYPSTGQNQGLDLRYSTDGSNLNQQYPSQGNNNRQPSEKSGFIPGAYAQAEPQAYSTHGTNARSLQTDAFQAPGPNQGMYVDTNTGRPVYMPADELANLLSDRNRITESLREYLSIPSKIKKLKFSNSLLGNLRLEDLGDMSRDDMKDKIKNVHLLVFDYVQAVSSK